VVVDILSVQQLSYSGHMRRLGKGIHSNDLRRKRFIMYICTGTSVCDWTTKLSHTVLFAGRGTTPSKKSPK